LKVFFDTSVIVAAFVSAHPKHGDCLPWLQKVKKSEITGIISAHSLLETYSVLTTLPLSPRINPSLAVNLIKENIISCFKIAEHKSGEYLKLLDDLALNELFGGASYDGLLLYAARKEKVDKILTLNLNDFIRAAPQLVRIISPP